MGPKLRRESLKRNFVVPGKIHAFFYPSQKCIIFVWNKIPSLPAGHRGYTAMHTLQSGQAPTAKDMGISKREELKSANINPRASSHVLDKISCRSCCGHTHHPLHQVGREATNTKHCFHKRGHVLSANPSLVHKTSFLSFALNSKRFSKCLTSKNKHQNNKLQNLAIYLATGYIISCLNFLNGFFRGHGRKNHSN